MNNAIEEELIDRLKAEVPEYQDYVVREDGQIDCLTRFLFTWAILSGLNDWGYEDRWCYHNYDDAKAALDAWDGTGEPTGWHRHPTTGRRLVDGQIVVEP